MRKISTYLYLFTIGIFLIIISPDLLSDGMFFDGLTYSALANNLSNNIGSFWFLHYTDTVLTNFHEHPPLAIGLESLLFDILGSNRLTERIYSLLTFVTTGYIIVLIWKEIVIEKYRYMGWLPLLMWVSIPTIQWSISNNMLENTMMIFTSSSLLFSIKSVNSINIKSNKLILIALSGLSLFLSFLSKGPVGLFPLSFFFWYYVFNSKYGFKNFLIDNALLITFTISPFLILFYTIPESLESLTIYFNKQVIGSINHVETVDTRFQVLLNLINDLIPSLIILLISILYSRKKQLVNETPQNDNKTWLYVLLAIGFSGVLPIMVSLKQSSFYIIPAYTLFCLAFALLLKDYALQITIYINSKRIKIVGIILFSIGITSTLLNSIRIGREKTIIKDIYSMESVLPKNTIISINKNMQKDYKLHAYFMRYENISLDNENNNIYLLTYKGSQNDRSSNYVKIDIELKAFDLYKKQK